MWQRRGFGVHSPYAYRLITEVIREKTPFYAYEDLDDIESSSSRKHDIYKIKKGKARLFFRLANRFQPQHILEVASSGGISTLYLKKACPSAKITIVENRRDVVEKTQEWLGREQCEAEILSTSLSKAIPLYLAHTDSPFILINRMPKEYYDNITAVLLQALVPNAIIVLCGINRKTQRTIWKRLIADNRVRVAIDMKQNGLILCNPKLNKQNYYI